MTGVAAQYYRDQIVENTKMGQREAAERGRWQNHPPTGYDMVNGHLEPNEMATLVQRIFALRAGGASYPVIAAEVGIKYSTVRSICLNRAYLGQVKYSGDEIENLMPPWSMNASSMPPNAATPKDSGAAKTSSGKGSLRALWTRCGGALQRPQPSHLPLPRTRDALFCSWAGRATDPPRGPSWHEGLGR